MLWIKKQSNMVIIWLSCDYHNMIILCSYNDHLLIIWWSSVDYLMIICWFSDDHLLFIWWSSKEYLRRSLLSLEYYVLLIIMWLSCNYHKDHHLMFYNDQLINTVDLLLMNKQKTNKQTDYKNCIWCWILCDHHVIIICQSSNDQLLIS